MKSHYLAQCVHVPLWWLATRVLHKLLPPYHGCILMHQIHDYNALWVIHTSGVTIVVESLPPSSSLSWPLRWTQFTEVTFKMDLVHQGAPRASAKGKSMRACWTLLERHPESLPDTLGLYSFTSLNSDFRACSSWIFNWELENSDVHKHFKSTLLGCYSKIIKWSLWAYMILSMFIAGGIFVAHCCHFTSKFPSAVKTLGTKSNNLLRLLKFRVLFSIRQIVYIIYVGMTTSDKILLKSCWMCSQPSQPVYT